MSTAAPHMNPASIVQNRSLLDRAIEAVSPGWAVKRLSNKLALHQFSYEASRQGRAWAPKTRGAPAESFQTSRDRVVMMWEALDLVENFPAAKGAVAKFSTFLTPNEWAPATGDRDYDAQLSEAFHAWCKHCDVTGRNSFRKLIQIAAETRPSYGDCGFVLREGRGELKLQLIPGDRIGNPNEGRTIGDDNYYSGVITDDFGAPIEYEIFRVTPSGQYVDPEKIPAKCFFHYFDPFRVDQYRGVTDFHAAIRTARMLKNILEAEETGVLFASQQAALIFNQRGQPSSRNLFTPTAATTMANGEQMKEEESKYGSIRYFTNGDDVKIMPSRPGSSFGGFVEALMGDIALGLGGYPAGVLWGTQNYKGPSVRAEFAQADRVNQKHQGTLTDKVLDPVKDAWILWAIANGEIKPPPRKAGESAEQAIIRATRGSWRFPAKLTIDTGRDSVARLAELAAGATSLQEIAAEDGADAFDRIDQLADAAQYISEAASKRSLPETAIRLPGGTLPTTPAAAAAVGDQAGADAAKAQADSVQTGKPEDKPQGDFETVAEAMQRPARRRSIYRAALGKTLQTHAGVRRALGHDAPSSDRINTTLDRFAGKVFEAKPKEKKRKQHVVNVGSPIVNVPQPVVNFTAPEQKPPTVNVEGSVVNMPAPVVQFNAPEQPAPIVNVPAPNVNVAAPTVNVAAPAVNVEAPKPVVVPAPKVQVNVPPMNAQITMKRDSRGKIEAADIKDKK